MNAPLQPAFKPVVTFLNVARACHIPSIDEANLFPGLGGFRGS